ncbi:MAG TPA: hypothetical protein VGH51_16860 [Candidatus Angelobacter sp.]|jgi:hypothetical protein
MPHIRKSINIPPILQLKILNSREQSSVAFFDARVKSQAIGQTVTVKAADQAPQAIADLHCYNCKTPILDLRSFKCHNWAYDCPQLLQVLGEEEIGE